MPAQTLLEIDSDELFEKHTIPEIKVIQEQIQNEIEKKKEELRVMVGEKCRDLLKAADIIIEMQETSKNIIEVINNTQELCQSLQAKRLLGFKQPTTKVSTPSSKNFEELSKVIEIKILLILPEQIWTAIDNKDYLLGAQLYLFATHLYLGLEVSSKSQNILDKYPVLSKQWSIINNCKQTIVDGACRELKVINISQEKASECLCCLILLELMSYEKLLNQFLDLRMESLDEILKSEKLSRNKLRQTVEILQHTLVIIYICFLGKPNQKCAIENVLNSIVGNEEKPTLSKIIQVSSWPEQYLSPLIKNFHPKTTSNLNLLQKDYITKILLVWLDNVEKLLKIELTKTLLLVDDIKRLHKITKEEIFNVKYPSDWEDIVQSLLGLNDLNIYNKFIKSYMTNRIKELIQISWQNSLNNVLLYLSEVDESFLKDRNKNLENDIRWFVWKENKVNTEEGLKLKTLGYTPRVMELCERMDSFLCQLLESVNLYVGQNSTAKSKANDDNDADLILKFLNSYSFEMIQRFVNFVKDNCNSGENNCLDSKIIIRARFLSSLTSQSPGLEKCLTPRINNEEDFNQSASNNSWQQAIVFLNDKSTEIWHIWRMYMSSKFQTLIKSKLNSNISLRSLLKSKLLSEIITIEEQTEDGTSVKSDLRIPSQPSLPLQELLFHICQQLNAVIPHTLPSQIHQDLVDSIVKDILEQYQEWCKSEVIYQTQAWQMLMDVRFLTLMLVIKENKELSQSICDTLEKSIDPFDLDVYFPHLQNSVKKSTQKLQGSFGILINFSEKLPVFNGLKLTKGTSSNQIEEPNLLALSSSVPWFPLLPIANVTARRANSSRADNQDSYSFKEFSTDKPNLKNREKENKKESVTSDFFKSAGAFFDAMTGGWS